jgi:ATP-dependent DNA helicase RecQ
LGQGFWERAKRLTELRRVEQRQMQEYVSLESGHMAFLIRALDGEPGVIQPPTLPLLPNTTSADLVREAITFLRRTSLPIEPRKQWPTGGLPQFEVAGNIGLNRRAEPGRCLCVWGDAGWGDLVRQGKYRDHHFSDDLVTACVGLVATWHPEPMPTWVTCIPSLRHPDLVPDLARRLAKALGLPFHAVLEKTAERPAQKTMANSSQQAHNLDGSLDIRQALPGGPVLLVDDMVDSRWTLTVAAWLLRRHGSGPVWPLALALTGHD